MSVSTEDEDRTSKFSTVLKALPVAATAPPPKRRRLSYFRFAVVAAVILAVVGLIGATVRKSMFTPAVNGNILTEKVRKADLIVSITEDGTVESAHNKDIKCEVQGGSTILWLIKDGTEVKKGDELVRLDSSLIEDKISQQKITFEKARAAKIDAEKAYDSAVIAVQEYEEGTFVQQMKNLEVTATVAKENLESARNTLQFTEKMTRKGYVTTLQRDAQAFAVERASLDRQVAEMAISVLEKFTKRKTLTGLESARDSAQARKASESAAFELESDRLARLENQLEKCTINAPDDGMVVYANEQQERRGGSSQQSMVEEGAMMRERQSIIKLPDLSQMQVKCTVHESKVDQLQRGMRARIQIQEHQYQGVVTSVSNQPEPTNFFSGSVKEYAAIVSIDSDPHGLRPGMTAAVEILVANLPDVLSVPVQAVVEKGGKFYCWINTPAGPKKREVVLGLNNNTRIELKDGPAVGEEVLLNPRATVEEANEDEKTEAAVNVKERFGGDKPKTLPKVSSGAPAPSGGAGASKGKSGRGGINIKELDKDGDGKLSKDEAPEQMKNYFDMIDTNKDGLIDASEMAAAAARRRQMEQQRGGGPGGPGGTGGS